MAREGHTEKRPVTIVLAPVSASAGHLCPAWTASRGIIRWLYDSVVPQTRLPDYYMRACARVCVH